MINSCFLIKLVEILTYFFRYLNANQLNDIISNLLKLVFTKTNKINLTKNN